MSEIAVLGGGCYWCLDAIYRRIRGVSAVAAGYSGGHVDNPTTSRVYDGDTGHAEVVQVTFDSSVIACKEILEIFFVMHNPTTLNQQDYDRGAEYRSIILYASEQQRKIAEDMKQNFAASIWKDPIVTEIIPLEKFWEAEVSMQDFYAKRPHVGYCQMIIDPKIQKLRQNFSKQFKETSS